MQLTKISGATAALLISMISASPIALNSHASGSIRVGPAESVTGSIEHSFKIHPTGSYKPNEPVPTGTGGRKPDFTIVPSGGKFGPHHGHPSGTAVESHDFPKPTGHVSKRAIGSDIVKGTGVKVSYKLKPTGTGAPHEHESGHAKPTGAGKFEPHHLKGTGSDDHKPKATGTGAVYEHQSVYAKPTGTGAKEHSQVSESGHAKPSGHKKLARAIESGHAKPTVTGAPKEHESGHAKPTGTAAAHESGHAKPASAKPSGKGDKEHKGEHHSGQAKPTGTGAAKGHESGHSKPTGHKESARAFESGHAKPTATGAAHPSGLAKPTGTAVHTQKPAVTGTGSHTHESIDFEFKTETLTFGSKTFTVTGVVPEGTGKPKN